MPKAKYYAVKIGHDGPRIYNNWEECKAKVSRYPGAVHKSFTSLQEAEDWLNPGDHSFTNPSKTLSSKNTEYLPGAEKRLQHKSVHERSLAGNSSSPGDSIKLSPEQRAVFKKVQDGHNVFFTGSAGTGKSVLLREIIRLRGGGASRTLGITASTGIAAVNIGGTTLHSWAGIGIGQEPIKNLVGKFCGQPKFAAVLERWRSVETLIIDEVSMLDGELFDKLECMARMLRHSDKPFGAIQLVLSGDFCQLPPVPGRDDKGTQMKVTFPFEAHSWNACIGKPMKLTKVFRQQNQAFADMLNEMRFGRLNLKTIEVFKQLSRKVNYTDGIEPTELFPTRAEVDKANSLRLQQLPGSLMTYRAEDTPGIDSKGIRITEQTMERLLERLIAPRIVQLKVGAQVMLIKNLIQGELVNGSVGQVTRFVTATNAMKENIPISKVEGREIRLRDLPKGLFCPVVRFIGNWEIMIVPQEFTINNADGGMEACREQLPLILAYALSIHKSQGQTLQRVKVDLKRIFEKGQAYVALSRATTIETLQVLSFDPSKIVADPRVIAWYGEAQGNNYQREKKVDSIDDEDAYFSF